MGSFVNVFDRDTGSSQVESIKFNVVKREQRKKLELRCNLQLFDAATHGITAQLIQKHGEKTTTNK